MSPYPDRLHHYTTPGGLRGIIETERIWATDVRFLNDSAELRYATDEFRRILNAPDTPLPTSDLRRDVETLFENADTQFRCFVACFCEDGDQLSQWRGYAAGVSGYSIEIDASQLRDSVKEQAGLNLMAQVHYGLKGTSDRMIAMIKRLDTDANDYHGDAVVARTNFWIILRALAIVKHPAFVEEREWRLVLPLDVNYGDIREFFSSGARPPLARVQFRDDRYGVVPYVELAFPRSVVIGVRVSPGEHAELRRAGAIDLLLQHDMSHVPVRMSEAPFRG